MNKNKLRILFALSILVSLVAATSGGIQNLSSALLSLCSDIRALIPIVSFLMIVAAAVVYALGQLLGAETRARASVWATAMLIGAVIGILIVVITPNILQALYGSGSFNVC